MDLNTTFDDKKTKLQKVAILGTSFIYEYDFGDGWQHEITVEGIEAWLGEGYDPERFDRHAANAAQLRMAWNRWGAK